MYCQHIDDAPYYDNTDIENDIEVVREDEDDIIPSNSSFEILQPAEHFVENESEDKRYPQRIRNKPKRLEDYSKSAVDLYYKVT